MSETPSVKIDGTARQVTDALYNILKHGREHAAQSEIDEAIYLNWRLAPDMFPFVRQVQIACDITARGLARLAGVEPPSRPDSETSFQELTDRVDFTLAFIATLDRDAIACDPNEMVTFPLRQKEETMSRGDYLNNFVRANAYFHVTTAYAILRSVGVPLSKADFLALKL